LSSYRRTIDDFERRLRERESNPLEIARRLFDADVEQRRAKIGSFEDKYGIKIRPRDSLNDIVGGLELKEKKKKKKDEASS
jgi:hypothetical protein